VFLGVSTNFKFVVFISIYLSVLVYGIGLIPSPDYVIIQFVVN
jgi:hypothetical protein